MSTLEEIIAHGNRSLGAGNYKCTENWVTCKDGFKLSVIAGGGAYCTPRVALGDTLMSGYDDVPASYSGPYLAVEVGYPSERPEPWNCSAWNDGYDRHEDHPVCDGWARYGDSDGEHEPSVYGYVPVEMVRALIAAHGGEAA